MAVQAIEARAPGKLVIAGEYGVLAGGPGIAVAVDVTASARITLLAEGNSELLIPERGEAHPFRWIAGAPPRWERTSPGALGLPLESVVATLYARGLLKRAGDLPPCRIELSTEAFHYTDGQGRRSKLGLGSSAAVVVALTGALLRFIGGAAADHATILQACWEAHRQLQGGAGSGLDVATALAGGVIGAEFPAPQTVPRVSPLAWPHRLHSVAIWTGVSASTPLMVARLQAWQGRQAGGSALAWLAGAAARVLALWRVGEAGPILAGLADFAEALKALDAAAGIGIYSAEHQRLADLAEQAGVIYKPSGAGGGDFGMAFGESREALGEFRAAASAAGFLGLDAQLGAQGLTVTGSLQARGASLVRVPGAAR